MMDYLEMLTAREQLMEDIDTIVEAQCGKGSEELIAYLCDAVCKNFPAK